MKNQARPSPEPGPARRSPGRTATLLQLTLIALPLSGAFGALHDQISYTVSSEYFTLFKFRQFALMDPRVPERLRAACVGFLASWWMGLPIGMLVAPMTLLFRDPRDMMRHGLRAYGAVVAFAMAFALAGLAGGYLSTASIDLARYRGWYLPPHVVHLRRFLCAGTMHNAAYLGGALGVIVAWVYLVLARALARPAPQAPQTKAPRPWEAGA